MRWFVRLSSATRTRSAADIGIVAASSPDTSVLATITRKLHRKS